MTDKKPFDARSLSHLDKNLRALVDEQYDLCLFKCSEKNISGISVCKDNCFKNTIVPYRFNLHASRDQEENLYRKCLAEKFPNVKPDDFVDCTQKIYNDRVQIMANYMFTVSEQILSELHWTIPTGEPFFDSIAIDSAVTYALLDSQMDDPSYISYLLWTLMLYNFSTIFNVIAMLQGRGWSSDSMRSEMGKDGFWQSSFTTQFEVWAKLSTPN